MVVFDAAEFHRRVVAASRQVIAKFTMQMPESEVCGFALYSDADATSLSVSLNCKTHLAKMQAKYPEDPVYFKWSPGEWSHEGFGEEFFADISEDMRRSCESVSEGPDFKQYCDAVFGLCVDALKELRQTELAGVIFAFSVTDTLDPETEIHWIRDTNCPSQAAEFERWIVQQ